MHIADSHWLHSTVLCLCAGLAPVHYSTVHSSNTHLNSDEWLSSRPSLFSSSLMTSMMCSGTVRSLSLSLNFSSMASLSSFSRPSSWRCMDGSEWRTVEARSLCSRRWTTDSQSSNLLDDLKLLLQQVLPVSLFDLLLHLWKKMCTI